MYIEYICVLFSSRIDTIFGEKTIDIYIFNVYFQIATFFKTSVYVHMCKKNASNFFRLKGRSVLISDLLTLLNKSCCEKISPFSCKIVKWSGEILNSP